MPRVTTQQQIIVTKTRSQHQEITQKANKRERVPFLFDDKKQVDSREEKKQEK